MNSTLKKQEKVKFLNSQAVDFVLRSLEQAEKCGFICNHEPMGDEDLKNVVNFLIAEIEMCQRPISVE